MRLQFEELAHRAVKELSRRLRASNTTRWFGFELEAAEPARAVVVLRVRRHHRQVHGVVHGGVIAALADTTAALAVYMALPRGTPLATIEMKINFLEPVAGGTVTAEGRMLRRGRNFAVAECDVRDHNGGLAAKALLTFAIRPTGFRRLKLGRKPARKKATRRK